MKTTCLFSSGSRKRWASAAVLLACTTVFSQTTTPTISSVNVSFGPPSSWNRFESGDPSHPEWAAIQIAGTSLDIQITDGSNTWQASGSAEFLEFMFKPTLDSASPTDTLWRIVRWTESRSAGP